MRNIAGVAREMSTTFREMLNPTEVESTSGTAVLPVDEMALTLAGALSIHFRPGPCFTSVVLLKVARCEQLMFYEHRLWDGVSPTQDVVCQRH